MIEIKNNPEPIKEPTPEEVLREKLKEPDYASYLIVLKLQELVDINRGILTLIYNSLTPKPDDKEGVLKKKK